MAWVVFILIGGFLGLSLSDAVHFLADNFYKEK
jgi:hypothetical protein